VIAGYVNANLLNSLLRLRSCTEGCFASTDCCGQSKESASLMNSNN
jgi:hypothetical protein